ncbi:MAG: hypothetical protein ABJC04_11630 [Verrucomicrobiota bacterium]
MAVRFDNEFNHVAFHARRRLLKITGTVLIVCGLFVIMDMMSKVPIPLTGAKAVFVGLLLLMLGLVSLYNGYKLPLREAIELVHSGGRSITTSELVHLMRVDRLTAERIIRRLIDKGFLRISADHGLAEEVFDPVK